MTEHNSTTSVITEKTDDRAERLGREPVFKLLISFSLPAIIGMTASSLYNIIDRVFIGNGVGPLAISGLALTLPIMTLTAAFGAMIGAGASAMVSIRLGQQRKDDATNILGNTLILNFIIGLFITIAGLIFLDPILYAFGASDDTIPYARDFTQIILLANLFNHNFIGLNNVMRASGYPGKAMWSSILTVAINIILAPVFIFVFDWGIRGAAIATAIAQLAGFCWVMLHFLNKNSFLHFKKGYYRLKKRIVKDILSIGMAPLLMNATASLVAVLVNTSLVKYGGNNGDLAVGAYGIIGSIAMLFIMIVMGINMGMQPIAGYNFGAKKPERVMEVYKLSIIWATVITTIGFILAMAFPYKIVSAFTTDSQMRELSTNAMKLVFLAFPLVGFQVVTSNLFQSIGKAGTAIFLSLSRQLIFLLPAILILPSFLGTNGVWIALPVGDTLAFIVTIVVILTQKNKLFTSKPSL